MNFRTRKAIKSFFILLLSCQFLTPSFSDDALSSEAAIHAQKAMLQVETTRNPIVYLLEEPSDEGKQRVSVTRIVPAALMVRKTRDHQVLSAILFLNSKNPSCCQLSFDTHPPLFALHRRLLI
jgi:hypothetical protein